MSQPISVQDIRNLRSATFHVMEDNFTRHGGQLLQRWNIYTNFAAQSNCLTKTPNNQ